MARGDTKIDLVRVSASGSTDIRPDANDEWIVKMVSLNNNANVRVEMRDSTGNVAYVIAGDKLTDIGGKMNFPISRDYYLRIYNGHSGAQDVAWGAIITKDG